MKFIKSVLHAMLDYAVDFDRRIHKLNRRLDIMTATVESILAQVAAEKAEVDKRLAEDAATMEAAVAGLQAEIDALKAQIANGTGVTPEQLEQISAAITDIFTPTQPAPTPDVTPVNPA